MVVQILDAYSAYKHFVENYKTFFAGSKRSTVNSQ